MCDKRYDPSFQDATSHKCCQQIHHAWYGWFNATGVTDWIEERSVHIQTEIEIVVQAFKYWRRLLGFFCTDKLATTNIVGTESGISDAAIFLSSSDGASKTSPESTSYLPTQVEVGVSQTSSGISWESQLAESQLAVWGTPPRTRGVVCHQIQH